MLQIELLVMQYNKVSSSSLTSTSIYHPYCTVKWTVLFLSLHLPFCISLSISPLSPSLFFSPPFFLSFFLSFFLLHLYFSLCLCPSCLSDLSAEAESGAAALPVQECPAADAVPVCPGAGEPGPGDAGDDTGPPAP